MIPGQIGYPGQFISPNSPQSLTLPPGGQWLVPCGVFMVALGAQSVLQWNDSNSGLWRTINCGASDRATQVASDGNNFRVINISSTIMGIGSITAGSGYAQSNTTMTFAAPNASNFPSITATATPIIGGSLSYTVTTAGTGYTNPMLFIPLPASCGGTPGLCIPATAHVSALSSGGISTIASDFAGAGYITAPLANTTTLTPAQFQSIPQAQLNLMNKLILIDPTGSGAVITPAIANGTPASGGLTGAIITNPGAGYDGTHIPAVTITTTGSGSGASATALPNLSLTSITVAGTNTGYTANVMLESTLGVVTAVYDELALPRAARARSAPSAGVLAAPVIEDAGSGFQTVPLIKQVGNATADGSVNASFTAVVGGVNNSLQYWQVG
jgi:hypothetical protein